ncbi:MAG: transporter substrate-binding domain-containing protein [Deltaproteobacteria bacterium]|nr:transporter substrate-binding domain-containing protein [Deltaproteobacteria bacterium]
MRDRWKANTIVRMAVVSVLFASIVLILHTSTSQARDVASVQHSNPTTSLKTIIVGDYYPYTYVNDKGIPNGFSVDIANAVTKVMDLKLEITVATWEHATKALADGTIDLLPMMAFSLERDKIFDFSVPHTIAYDAVFSRSGAQRINSLKDLVDKTVIVMNKDAAHDYLLSSGMAGKMKIVLVDSLPDALRTLAAGKGDAALMPKLVGLIIMKKLNLTNIDPSPVVIDAYNRPFCFAVKNGNQALLERLSQGLSIIKSTGRYQEIYEKWFGALEPHGLSWETVIKYIGAISAVFLLIGSGLILWTVSLRKQVSLRTKNLEAEIQERKRAEDEIHRLNAELEQRVIDRTAQLEIANKELEAFTYSVSHDLKAPLRAIDGYAQILIEDHAVRLDGEGRRTCEVISNNALKMGRLIDALLALSRTGRIEMNPATIDMATMANAAFFELTTPEKRNRIDFHVGSLPHAVGDPTLLLQVWVNLIGNAVKFSAQKERAVIEVGCLSEGNGHPSAGGHEEVVSMEHLPSAIPIPNSERVYFIRDNGVGFDMAYVDKLFGVFQRLHSEKEFEGTGAGLSIVQRIVQRHGGMIWAEGEKGKGATFYFSIAKV